MFSTLAHLTSKYKWLIAVFWVAVAAIFYVVAPSLSEVGVTDDAQFLPENTESTRAEALLKEKFAGAVDESPGSALIVIYDAGGLSESDTQAAQGLHDWLVSPEAPDVITAVTSVFDNEALRSTLVSQDQTAMLISLDLSSASASAPSREAVQEIRNYANSQYPETQIYLTGNAGVTSDILTSVQQTIDRATLVTVILVIVLLLLIYRSPVAMLVPLITIGMSYLISRSIAGFIAVSGVNVSSLVDVYLVVTLFGIGTDYCLFLVSRYKEELLQNDQQTAARMALKRIGPVILASATTVIVALLCLGVSRFGMNRNSGFMMAIGVAITLMAGLTLTPALMSIFGRKLLWPGKLQTSPRSSVGLWSRIGTRITQRPVIFLIPIIVVLLVAYLALPKISYSANLLSQMPEEMGSVQGYDLLKDHFAVSEIDPLYVVIESENLTEAGSRQAITAIAGSLQEVPNVSRVRYFASPADQLQQLSQQTQSFGENLSLTTLTQLSSLQSVSQTLQSLAVEYTGVTQSPNFQGAVSSLTQISTLAGQLTTASPQNVPELAAQIKSLIDSTAGNLAGLSAEFNLETSTAFTVWLQSAYFATDGTAARIDVILETDPYSSTSIETVSQIRKNLAASIETSPIPGAAYHVGGTSAAQADILAINSTDFNRVLALAIIGILLVTIILLRSLIAPLYMIVTVLFNFGATLGISTWLFLDVLKQSNIIYMLPIFVLVILIAVGSDYNIFLVSRIREETQHKSMKEAIRHSVANTGGVITSCGIILAGTFATLTTASLQMVFQVGAAIGIGVLIDTFLVRAILIPSIATLIGRWSWWPSKLGRKS